ncbi:MAG: DUF4398 domain-containing protein [Gammaproteobacteria bacterium]|nr:DUF4398 domain-containing protein [Gammaproteobacteria bacterium]MDH5650819.1 DUF4398 domain-containing protein [Gammaproteobacteria bacterium]
MKKTLPFMIAAALMLSACGTPEQKHTKNDAEGAIMAAEVANKQAKKAEFEWTTTGKLIDKAKEAAKNGEFDNAVKFANKAKKESMLALEQAKAGKNGPR